MIKNCRVNILKSSTFAQAIVGLGLALAFLLPTCSAVDTRVDKGRITAHTFSFLNTGNQQTPSYLEARKEAHAMIQKAITDNLAARGISSVPSGGDITVAYLVVVGNNAQTTSLNRYFGYTADADALVEKVHKAQTQKNKDRNYFESGTLVVDILDAKTSKVLQRRSINAPILRDLPAEKRAARVQAIVDQALKDLPFAK